MLAITKILIFRVWGIKFKTIRDKFEGNMRGLSERGLMGCIGDLCKGPPVVTLLT